DAAARADDLVHGRRHHRRQERRRRADSCVAAVSARRTHGPAVQRRLLHAAGAAGLAGLRPPAARPVRQLVNSQEAAAIAAGVSPGTFAISWVATTQSTTVSLQAIDSVVEQSPP